MWLTKNEKEVLKLLLANGKLSDTYIAKKLNISTQAMGRIRRRLEQNVILKYSVELNKKELGASIIARMKIKFHSFTKKTIEEEEKRLVAAKNNIYVFKVLSGGGEYIIIAGFRDAEELKNITEEYRNCVKTGFTLREIIVTPFSCILKDSSSDWCENMIEFVGTKHTGVDMNNNFNLTKA